MKDFDWSQFTQKIAIKAPMQVLYNAWAIPEEIERWFLSKANYYDQNGAIFLKTNLFRLKIRFIGIGMVMTAWKKTKL